MLTPKYFKGRWWELKGNKSPAMIIYGIFMMPLYSYGYIGVAFDRKVCLSLKWSVYTQPQIQTYTHARSMLAHVYTHTMSGNRIYSGKPPIPAEHNQQLQVEEPITL